MLPESGTENGKCRNANYKYKNREMENGKMDIFRQSQIEGYLLSKNTMPFGLTKSYLLITLMSRLSYIYS